MIFKKVGGCSSVNFISSPVQISESDMKFFCRTVEFYCFFPPFIFFQLFSSLCNFQKCIAFVFFSFLNRFNVQYSNIYYWITFICLIYLSLTIINNNNPWQSLRSLTIFLKVLNKVNFRVLTQTLNYFSLLVYSCLQNSCSY